MLLLWKEFPGRQISIQASYLEIYDEEIHDLLSVDPFHGEIVLQEDPNTVCGKFFRKILV